MLTMGRHSPPLDGTVTANGRALAPFTIPGPLRAPPSWPVSVLPQPDDPGQPRTADEPGRQRRRDGTAFIVVALFAVAQVAVVAFSGSWQHQYELSVQSAECRLEGNEVLGRIVDQQDLNPAIRGWLSRDLCPLGGSRHRFHYPATVSVTGDRSWARTSQTRKIENS